MAWQFIFLRLFSFTFLVDVVAAAAVSYERRARLRDTDNEDATELPGLVFLLFLSL